MTRQSSFDRIRDIIERPVTPPPPEDREVDCGECAGTGAQGVDGPPCVYCDGSGVWT